MAELNKKFSGQAAARLGTYAGKMDLLAVASADAQEIIGKGLLDALTLLSDDNTVESLATNMEDFATATAEVILGLAQVIKKLKEITTIPGLGNAFDARNIPVIGAYIGGLRQIGRNAMPQQDRGGQERTASRIFVQQVKQEKRVADQLARARAEELRLIAAKNAIENKNVKELEKRFDLERIGLTAALNSATDEETKLRIQAQLAILDNNEALAKKIIAELEATDALRKLAEQARLAGMSLEDFALFRVKTLNTKIDDYLQNTALEMVRALNAQIAAFISALGGVSGFAGTFDPARVRMGEERSMADLKITVDTAQTGDRFAQLVAESIQIATKSGISYGIAGGL
jgi:hypothetical protein